MYHYRSQFGLFLAFLILITGSGCGSKTEAVKPDKFEPKPPAFNEGVVPSNSANGGAVSE